MSSSEFHHYNRDEFLAEFYPDPADKAAIAAGMKQLRAEQRAFRLAEMRRRLGITQAPDLRREVIHNLDDQGGISSHSCASLLNLW